jgi:Na+-transporting NADH:ubiquinone oxidoreductase subunit NqrC
MALYWTDFVAKYSYGVDLVPIQKRKLLQLVQSIQQHDLSKYIENAITFKVTDEDDTEENESDDSNNTYQQDEYDDESNSSSCDMAIDEDAEYSI